MMISVIFRLILKVHGAPTPFFILIKENYDLYGNDEKGFEIIF